MFTQPWRFWFLFSGTKCEANRWSTGHCCIRFLTYNSRLAWPINIQTRSQHWINEECAFIQDPVKKRLLDQERKSHYPLLFKTYSHPARSSSLKIGADGTPKLLWWHLIQFISQVLLTEQAVAYVVIISTFDSKSSATPLQWSKWTRKYM